MFVIVLGLLGAASAAGMGLAMLTENPLFMAGGGSLGALAVVYAVNATRRTCLKFAFSGAVAGWSGACLFGAIGGVLGAIVGVLATPVITIIGGVILAKHFFPDPSGAPGWREAE